MTHSFFTGVAAFGVPVPVSGTTDPLLWPAVLLASAVRLEVEKGTVGCLRAELRGPGLKQSPVTGCRFRAQELCESRGGRPGDEVVFNVLRCQLTY